MDKATDQAGNRFVFRINEDEAMMFRQLLVKNQKRYISRRLTIGAPLFSFACVLVPVWIAYYRDLLPISTLLIAELSLGAGYLGLLVAVVAGSRRMFRDMFRATRSAQVSFDCSFDDTRVVVKKGTLETRMTWDAISGIEDVTSIVAFWYDPTQGFLVPGRVFSGDAARITFAAWAVERVRAATPPPTATPGSLQS